MVFTSADNALRLKIRHIHYLRRWNREKSKFELPAPQYLLHTLGWSTRIGVDISTPERYFDALYYYFLKDFDIFWDIYKYYYYYLFIYTLRLTNTNIVTRNPLPKCLSKMIAALHRRSLYVKFD